MPSPLRKPCRIALVIGNAAYGGDQKLNSPINDAEAIAEKLGSKDLGFEVFGARRTDAPGIDLDPGGMAILYGKFIAAIEKARAGGEVVHAVIHYSGHGLQIADENYLVPIGVGLKDAGSINLLFPLKDRLLKVAESVGSTGMVIAFFDACRSTPFDANEIRMLANDIRRREQEQAAERQVSHEPRVTAVSRGFSIPSVGLTEEGRQGRLAPTFIAFATAPGEVAWDSAGGEKAKSPFTTALCTHIGDRGLEIEEFYNRVQKDVRAIVRAGNVTSAATGADARIKAPPREQIPWSESNLQEPFYFHPSSWEPVWQLTLLGWLAGFLTCIALFNPDLSMRSAEENPLLWLTGAFLAALVAGYGTGRWGSRTRGHVAFATLGTMLAFALALGILQNQIVLDTIQRVGKGKGLDLGELIWPSWIEHALAGVAACAVIWGCLLQVPSNASLWQSIRPWLSGVATFLVLLAMQLIGSIHSQPGIVVFAMLSLVSGLTLGLGMVMSCRPQQSLFSGFGPVTGGMAAGMLMPVLFLVYAMLPSTLTLYAIAPLYFAVLGFQLGWCFRWYVKVHRPAA